MLMLLVSGQRLDTIYKLRIDHMEVSHSKYVFTVLEPLKQSRKGYTNPQIVFGAFPADKRICVHHYLTKYLVSTLTARKAEKYLFLTYQKPIHRASKNTLSRWVKHILTESGIDIHKFSSHSTRSASSSAAKRGGASVEEVLATAGWSNVGTFATYYNKPIISQKNISYATAVLKR
jgi:hypothetical protein